jgi:hypothetical protein
MLVARSMKTVGLVAAGVAMAATFSVSACSSHSKPAAESTPGPQASGRARPADVPIAAKALDKDVTMGAPSPATGTPFDEADVFYSLRCANGLLAVATTKETVYAELPCDRSPPDNAIHQFLAKPIEIRIATGEPTRLFLDSQAGTIEFTVGGVWVETR